MGLGKKSLAGLKTELLERRSLISEDLRKSTVDLINDDVIYTDTIDQASADTEKAFRLQLKSRERRLLYQIEDALKRMEAGAYGDCERCNEEISEARLTAFPFTTLCVDCQAETEQERGRLASRLISF